MKLNVNCLLLLQCCNQGEKQNAQGNIRKGIKDFEILGSKEGKKYIYGNGGFENVYIYMGMGIFLFSFLWVWDITWHLGILRGIGDLGIVV